MVTLVILDGFGYNENQKGNAIKQAGTPNLDKLKSMFPSTLLNCVGESVGLEKNQMSGSEVGHLNLGAGRVVYQDLTKINKAIQSGEFENNKALLKAINHCKKFNSSLHLMGLVSDSGVHSKLNHLVKIVDLAKSHGLEKIFIHCFTDGRDSLKNSGIDFVKTLEKEIAAKAEIKSLCGRAFAMDREKRFERTQMAYDMLVLAKAENFYQSAEKALAESYKKNVFDEFVQPTIIGKPEKIKSDDSVVFFNFRADRARQLTQAIAEQNIEQMQLVNLKNLCFVCMTEYDKSFQSVEVAFEKTVVEDNLSAIISKNNKKQFHISETTKYAHVTFFFNGGIEKAYDGEDRCLIESHNVTDFSVVPQMRAVEITEKTIEALSKNEYDFIIVNLSNADMIGHTGDFEATKKAITCVDKCAYLIALATLSVGGDCLITADHGNADEMLDESGNVVTSHSMNPVEFILASEKHKNITLEKDKALSSVAPTILKLLNIEIPTTMEKPLF